MSKRLIGLCSAWCAEDWIVPFLQNSLEYLDELLIHVNYFHPDFKRLEDNTSKVVSEFAKTEKKIRILEAGANNDPSVPPDVFRCKILNRMIQNFRPGTGDVLVISDVDELYDKEGMNEIHTFLNSSYDLGIVHGLYFCVNMDWFVENTDMWRFFRFVPGFYFVPAQNPRPIPKVRYTFKSKMFHYSMLINPEMKRVYWRHSPVGDRIVQDRKLRWHEEIYMKWDPIHEEIGLAKNRSLTGSKGFWLTDKDTVVEKKGGGLSMFSGKHPEQIEKSHLRRVADFRGWYKR